MHEIVTLQLGQRANYLATHFWNTQESYFTYSEQDESIVDHDIHFRAGLAADSRTETFTPRTVIYDLKGGFGSLKKLNALYDVQNEPAAIEGLWHGSTSTQRQPVIPLNEYQHNLEQGLPTKQVQSQDVRYWSDFNRLYYHPRSIVQINDYELNSQLMPFENWNAGGELFDSLDREDDILGRDVRHFAEECNQMQGFQIFAGTDDAWGGFASKYLDHLRDEYGKTSIWVFAIEDGKRVARQQMASRLLSSARSLQAVADNASAYVQLSTHPSGLPSYVNLYDQSDWLRTALLCSGIESITLPTRLRRIATRACSLSILEDTLKANEHQNLFELQFSVKNASSVNGHPANGVQEHADNADGMEIDESFTPQTFDIRTSRSISSPSGPTHVFSQIECIRAEEVRQSEGALSLDERMRRRVEEQTIVEKYTARLPFPVLDSFPDRLFNVHTTSHSLEIDAAIMSTSQIKNHVLNLRTSATRLLEVDEREAMYNDLTERANHYSYGFNSDSAEEDD